MDHLLSKECEIFTPSFKIVVFTLKTESHLQLYFGCQGNLPFFMSEPFEENLESTESRRMKIQTKATFLETYLHIQSKMDMYPLDAQEDLRYDSARLLFLVLPDEVVA